MKAFFKDVCRRLAVLLVSALFFGVLSLVVFSFFAESLLRPPKEKIKKDSFLVLNLNMNLTERPGNLTIEDLTREALTQEKLIPTYHLKEVIDGLRIAAKDNRLKGIFIMGGFLPSGYGCGYETVREFVFALEEFKQSGKKVVGYLHSPKQLDYMVYAHCDELIMDPAGTMILQGLSSEQLFLGDSLKKYGVGIQVVRTGKFKGAVEPFTNNCFSEENRAQIQGLLDSRWLDYIATISTARSMLDEDLNATLSAKYLWKPQEALEKGFVDRIENFGGVIDHLIELGSENDDENTFAQVEFGDYLERQRPDPLEEDDKSQKLAIIYVEGAIVDGWGDDGISVGGDEVASRIREIRKQNDVYRAIVLRVNSPGGSVSGSEAILFELEHARRAGIPVIVSMGPVAASGGHWIATERDRIAAGRQTITGSIGVFGILPNIQSLGSDYGLNWDVVKTNPSSDIMSISRPKNQEEIKVIQGYVDQTYDRFLELVGTSRNIENEEVRKLAEGRVWTGEDAVKIGLVDQLGGLNEAIAIAVEFAEISGDFKVEEFPRLESPAEAIAELLGAETLPANLSLPQSNNPILNRIIDDEPFFNAFNDPLGLYGILPWYHGQIGFASWKINLCIKKSFYNLAVLLPSFPQVMR